MKKQAPKRTIINDEPNMYYDEYNIRKKSGKIRKIIAPSPDLKRYSRKAMHHLNSYFKQQAIKSEVIDNFHGFIPGRNAITAAEKHIGYQSTIMMDFSNFFDTVNLDMFDEYMFEQQDVDEDYLFHKDGYAAQGFPSSPTLANIALIDLIRESKEIMNAKFEKDFVITIYADDICISYDKIQFEDGKPIYNKEKDTDWKWIRDTFTSLALDYDFQINENKTRVKFAKYGWRRILGVNVGDTETRATRKTVKKIRAVRHKVKTKEKREIGHYYQVLGGLVTWSKNKKPNNFNKTN